MLIVFAAAIFVSAALLFLVQPMAARMILPLLGGTPAVWNTCMVFFQAVLLAGYAYSHGLTRVRRPWVQVAVHAVVSGLPLALLPVGLREGAEPPSSGSPVPWLLAALAVAVGGPFFVLSTTGPLLQRWFSRTDHPAAGDPYFLYAASNAGSLIALLGYPFVVEPFLTLKRQGVLWSWGYGVLAVLLVVCGVLGVRRAGVERVAEPGAAATGSGPPTWRTRAIWVLLAFAPTSLMLGVTSYISTDLAAVPLLWILPLTVYLLTMIVAFSKGRERVMGVARVATPILAVGLAVTMVLQLKGPIGLLVGLHLAFLLAAAMACHGRLASLRPSPEHLTGFFLLVSLGGVLGGIFSALVAPMTGGVFNAWVAPLTGGISNALAAPLVVNAVFEYPVAIALACWLGMTRPRESAGEGRGFRPEVVVLDVLLPLVVVASLRYGSALVKELELPKVMELAATLFVPVVGCAVLAFWPRRFALSVGLMMLLAVMSFGGGRVRVAERSFFGVHRVVDTPDGRFRKMLHGSTNHGMQAIEGAAQRAPLSYYTAEGPAGQVFGALNGAFRIREAGIIGLGAGSLASYARPGQRFAYYEIDPVVVRIASDPKLFTYLSGCAGEVATILGDGRLSLRHDEKARYDLLVLDAFSSDAIPVHLLTVEAFEVYLSRLADRGLLLLHLTNRHLDLTPVVAGIAGQLGLVARVNHDRPTPEQEARWGAEARAECLWVLVARKEADMGALALDKRWQPIAGEGIVWTDDFSNIVRVLKP